MKGPRRQRDRRLTKKPVPTERRAEQRRTEVAAERRAAVRVPIDLWMEEVRGDEVYFRRSCNISEGGVFFDQSIPHATGTAVTLRFQLPGTDVHIEVAGEVASAARATDGLGMGVKFTSISNEVKKSLRDFVAALVPKRGTL